MTERFRYPPKGYAKQNNTYNEENAHNIVSSAVRSPNPGMKQTLTSSVSQQIHMDRVQNENTSGGVSRKLINEARPKSGRISGREFKYESCAFQMILYLCA